ncbi:MAG: OmpA family protein [Leptothrix sp. (in: b-proteobacteria)]
MKLHNIKRLVAACVWLLGQPAVQAQVVVMERVPSLTELRVALKLASGDAGGAAAMAPPAQQVRTRRIVWDTPAQSPASAVTAAQPAAVGNPAVVAMPISFEPNSSRVMRSSLGYVESVAQLLESNAQLKLAIEGHTDSNGGPQRNLPLSWERALSVYRLLVEYYGVDARRLEPVGKGSSEPLDGLPLTAPMNRRVQFRVIG